MALAMILWFQLFSVFYYFDSDSKRKQTKSIRGFLGISDTEDVDAYPQDDGAEQHDATQTAAKDAAASAISCASASFFHLK